MWHAGMLKCVVAGNERSRLAGAAGGRVGNRDACIPSPILLCATAPRTSRLPLLSLPCLQRVRAAVEAQAATEGGEGPQQPAGPLEDDPTYK